MTIPPRDRTNAVPEPSGDALMVHTRVSGRVLGTNMVSAAFSRLWRTGLQIVFTPLFIRLLGPEAYGLVAFNATLLMLVLFLDHAVSPVVIREFGRLGGRTGNSAMMRDLLRSLEVVSFVTAMVLGVAIFAAAPWIATNWLNRLRKISLTYPQRHDSCQV